MIRTLPVLLVAAGLGACTARTAAPPSAAGPRYASLDATLDASPPAARAPTPVVVLPDWIGRPTDLAERDGAEAFEQTVTLALAPHTPPGENRIILSAPREAAAAGAPGGRPTEAGIRAELAAVFPGTPMQVVTRPARNAYGPYGLAVGRAAGGARCLYAWQWIDDAPAIDAAGRRPLSLRFRLCRDDITLEAMAAAVNEMRLVPRWQGEAVARVAAGRPIVRGRKTRRTAMAGRRRPAPAERIALPAVEPVQAPPGRRYLGAEAGPAAEPRADIPARVAPAGPSMRGVLAGLGTPAGGSSGAPIAADLPPEAYRGPAARVGGRP